MVNKANCDDCWPWTGARSSRGEGKFNGQQAHRVAYVFTQGPFEKRRALVQSCANKLCCNPAHMQPEVMRTAEEQAARTKRLQKEWWALNQGKNKEYKRKEASLYPERIRERARKNYATHRLARRAADT